MKKEQLVESIRDMIYEVLEEELDRKIQEAKKVSGAKALTEAKVAKQKAIRLAVAKRKAALVKEARIRKMRQIVREHDAKTAPRKVRKQQSR